MAISEVASGNDGQEMARCLVDKFWQANYDHAPAIYAKAFAQFTKPGVANKA